MNNHIEELVAEFDDIVGKSWAYFSATDVHKLIVASLKLKSIVHLFRDHHTEINFDRMSGTQRVLLLKENYKFFSKVIDVRKIESGYLVPLFLTYSSVRKYIDWKAVSKKDLGTIAQYKPEYFRKYSLPLRNLHGESWMLLLDHDATRYVDLFLAHIASIRNKTQLRFIVRNSPVIAQKLTIGHIESSVLSVKEWLLFFNAKFAKKQGTRLNQTVRDWLDMQFHMDVLAGTASTSLYTSKARKNNAQV